MNTKTLECIVKGMATYLPGVYNLTRQSKGSGGTISARYCYSVWLRHLVVAYENKLTVIPKVVAELGPGDSLGVGLAALLSGASKYYAFDIVEYANNKRNVETFDELTDLFKKRQRIPDQSEFPQIKPRLKSYEFPRHILTDERLESALEQHRIGPIKKTLLHLDGSVDYNACINYFVPWHNPRIIKEESVDMIYSQAVLEHVEDLAYVYKTMQQWLKPGGFISHEIDFTSHGKAKEWNGHWAYSDFIWSLIKGKRPYLLNREPCSTHITLIKELGFELACAIRSKEYSRIEKKDLTHRFRNMPDDDLATRAVFIQAVKK